MKTAISIPDELFKTAEKTAKKLGIPRSQLFAKALEEFIQSHSKESVTEKLNKVYNSKSSETKNNITDLSVESLRKSLKMIRGEIWWVDLGIPFGSEPGFKRPVLIIQDDSFNQSNINTIVSIAITSNLNLSEAPGNVLISKKDSNLSKDSVVNVSQIVTLDKKRFLNKVGKLKSNKLNEVEAGLKLVTDLD